jgi:hypothetical protein
LNTLCSGFNVYGISILTTFFNQGQLLSIAANHGTVTTEDVHISANVESAQEIGALASGGVPVANAPPHLLAISDPLQCRLSNSSVTGEPGDDTTIPSDAALPLDARTSVATHAHDTIEAAEDTTLVSTQEPAATHPSQPQTKVGVGTVRESELPAEPSVLLRVLQTQFALINMTGRIWVLDKKLLTATTGHGTAQKLILSNRNDGTLLLNRMARAERSVTNAKDDIKDFFVSPDTTCYAGVEFNPAGTTSNLLNLWIGPTITAASGTWLLIKAFLLNVICNGDQSHYDYLIGFIAHALQRPWEKPGVIIILIGGQGIGKGTLGRILRMIWRATFLQVHNVGTVTGNFNADLERTFIVFMDEALFVGDRRASDALKSLVTEQVININEKHQPSRQINSYHRFFIATNADHVKQTDRDDRRDFALRVSEAHKGDYTYWNALEYEMVNGGVAAMVHDLLAMDLTDFNVRAKPNTQELVGQKVHSLVGVARWWYDALYLGVVGQEWPDFIATDSIIKGVMDMAGRKLYQSPNAAEVIQAMSKLCPSAVKGQKQESLGRHRGLRIPPLAQARAEFEGYIGGAVHWDEESTTEEILQEDDLNIY